MKVSLDKLIHTLVNYWSNTHDIIEIHKTRIEDCETVQNCKLLFEDMVEDERANLLMIQYCIETMMDWKQ